MWIPIFALLHPSPVGCLLSLVDWCQFKALLMNLFKHTKELIELQNHIELKPKFKKFYQLYRRKLITILCYGQWVEHGFSVVIQLLYY